MIAAEVICGGALCPACGPGHGWQFEFCDDHRLSDCAYCGRTTPAISLSENLACETCEGGVS